MRVLIIPVVFAEFAARLRALARRGEQPAPEGRLTLGDLRSCHQFVIDASWECHGACLR